MMLSYNHNTIIKISPFMKPGQIAFSKSKCSHRHVGMCSTMHSCSLCLPCLGGEGVIPITGDTMLVP